MKARRYLINKTPKRIAAPLAKALLPTVTTSAEVVREARTWVGVPFRHQGRDRSGVDCGGIIAVVLRELGALPDGFDLVGYPHRQSVESIEPNIQAHCTVLPEPVPGALIAIRFQRTITHVGIYTDTDTLIHALEKHGRVIEHGFRGMWKTRYAAGYWALPGVRYG